ncbi:hypothetical protein K3495_g85 [Podosphaera aphanis]|nr:hypothetical protein K3495_g85 [Podosphaera aphanis]
MNRFGRKPNIGGASKATPSTLCQKCLVKGHYSYECKTIAQNRPYVSRPSRTQQLRDPKLVPELTNSTPNELLRKKGIADEQLARSEEQRRGQKRSRQIEGSKSPVKSKRLRSASSSSVSVSTISTVSTSSPPPRRNSPAIQKSAKSISSPWKNNTAIRSRSIPKAVSPAFRQSPADIKRRRESSSSADSYISDGGQSTDQRATRRRYRSKSPPFRGRPITSRSPTARHRRKPSMDRGNPDIRCRDKGIRLRESKPVSREQSLSPFSKRLALTQALSSRK